VYYIYRTASGGTPASLGNIGKVAYGASTTGASCSASICVFYDQALTGDATTPQPCNTTGQVFVGAGPVVCGGSGGGFYATAGTAATYVAVSTTDGIYPNSTDGNLHVTNGQVPSTTTPNDWGYLTGVVGKTSQKAETGSADASVLSVTPVVLAGTYRANVAISVTSGTSCVVGWTATWHDPYGAAQTPAELTLFQNGTATPALTYTVSAAGDYHGDAIIDVDNSGTAIIIKWIGGGTCAAKMTAVLEKIN
jgi:hypothetical protein